MGEDCGTQVSSHGNEVDIFVMCTFLVEPMMMK